MDTCQHCGTVLPTANGAGPYCPNCGAAVAAGQGYASGEYDRPDLSASQTHLSAPTAAFAPVPAGAGDQAGDPYEAYFRPPPGTPGPHTRTQVMPAVPAPAFAAAPVQIQPGYDQPIDYRPGTGQAYPEQYQDPYDDGYETQGAEPPRSSRAAKIGVAAAAGAVLVIIVSLITIGGHKSPSSPQAANDGPTQVVVPTPQEQQSEVAPPAGSPTTSPTVAPTTHVPGQLQLGDSGPDVKWLQARLKQLNLYPGQVTGTFDAATQAAVRAFQSHAHPADPAGVVGRSTKTALIAWGSRPKLSVLTPDPGKRPRNGAPSADDVKRLQHALTVAIGQDVKATGTFDAATMGAVMQYEVQVGLMPDGAVGDKVWGALQQGKLKP